MSVHGTVHGIFGALVFSLMPVSCFVFLRRFREVKALLATQGDELILWLLIEGADAGVKGSAHGSLSARPLTSGGWVPVYTGGQPRSTDTIQSGAGRHLTQGVARGWPS
jgi:hypothetical protein